MRHFYQPDSRFEEEVFNLITAEHTDVLITDQYQIYDEQLVIRDKIVYFCGEKGEKGDKGDKGDPGVGAIDASINSEQIVTGEYWLDNGVRK